MSRGELWTAEEDRILREKYPTCGADIPELLEHRGRNSIISRAFRLNLKVAERWTAEEDRILREKYPTCGADIPELLEHKSARVIWRRAAYIKLGYGGRSKPWTAKEDAIVREKYPICGANIPELLNHRTADAIAGRAFGLGIRINNSSSKPRWTSEELQVLREKYPMYGKNIPELLNRRGAQAIQIKASTLGLSSRSPSHYNSSIASLRFLYTGEVDGRKWYACKCAVCESWCIVNTDEAEEFSHGELCTKRAILVSESVMLERIHHMRGHGN